MNSSCIIIPAYNEEETIQSVVEALKKFADIIVVDDGSTDNTVSLAEKSATHIVQNEKNSGYDYSIGVGIDHAIALGYKYAAFCDADGQFTPNDVQHVLKLVSTENPLVVGVREETARISEWLFAMVTSFYGVKDPLCGLKGFRLEYLIQIKNPRDYDSVGTFEMAHLIASGVTVTNFPIKILPRVGNSKFGAGIKPNLRIIRALIHFMRIQYDRKP